MGIFDVFRRKAKTSASMEEVMASKANDFIEAFRGDRSPLDAEKLDFGRDSLALVDSILQDYYSQDALLPDDLHFLAPLMYSSVPEGSMAEGT